MEKIVSLAKRRGFVYPGSEIYGGLASTYDYGPLGIKIFPTGILFFVSPPKCPKRIISLAPSFIKCWA